MKKGFSLHHVFVQGPDFQLAGQGILTAGWWLGRVQAVSHLSTIPSILEGGNLPRDCMTPSQEAVQVPVGCVPLARLLEET